MNSLKSQLQDFSDNVLNVASSVTYLIVVHFFLNYSDKENVQFI